MINPCFSQILQAREMKVLSPSPPHTKVYLTVDVQVRRWTETPALGVEVQKGASLDKEVQANDTPTLSGMHIALSFLPVIVVNAAVHLEAADGSAK
jgi:hypothetical protein